VNVKRIAVGLMAAAVIGTPLAACGSSSQASYESVCRDNRTGRIYPAYNCRFQSVYVPYDYYSSHQSVFAPGRTVSTTVITSSRTTTATPKNAQVFRPDAKGNQQVTTTSKSGKAAGYKTATRSQLSGATKPKTSSKSGGSSSVKSGSSKSGSGSSYKSGGSKSGGSSYKSGSGSSYRSK
jgi:hypothetical protein